MTLAALFSQNFRSLRLRRRLSQEALAHKLRLSVSYVSMPERGTRTPPLPTLERIAKVFAVAPSYFLEHQPGPKLDVDLRMRKFRTGSE